MPKMDLKGFIGKKDDELEKAHGFTHYIETKDEFQTGKKVKHKDLIDALFRFSGNQNLKAVKTDNGTILEISGISLDEAKKNLTLFAKNEGPFYDEDIYINYSILGENFYAFSHGVLMFSASWENVQKMAKILDEYSIKYYEPDAIDSIIHIPQLLLPKKPERNELCYCGSGKKYKTCCWLKETENKGESIWSCGEFAETMGGKEAEEKLKTFHKKHDEDVNYGCKKCGKKISAHNRDWHDRMCDDCFHKTHFSQG